MSEQRKPYFKELSPEKAELNVGDNVWVLRYAHPTANERAFNVTIVAATIIDLFRDKYHKLQAAIRIEEKDGPFDYKIDYNTLLAVHTAAARIQKHSMKGDVRAPLPMTISAEDIAHDVSTTIDELGLSTDGLLRIPRRQPNQKEGPGEDIVWTVEPEGRLEKTDPKTGTSTVVLHLEDGNEQHFDIPTELLTTVNELQPTPEVTNDTRVDNDTIASDLTPTQVEIVKMIKDVLRSLTSLTEIKEHLPLLEQAVAARVDEEFQTAKDNQTKKNTEPLIITSFPAGFAGGHQIMCTLLREPDGTYRPVLSGLETTLS